MSEWKEYKLGNIAIFSQGIQVDPDKQLLEKRDGYVRFIRIVDYSKEGSEPPRYIEYPGERYIVSEDDLVMIRYGSQTAGKIVRGISGAIANNTFKIVLLENITTKDFIYYLLSQQSICDYFMMAQASSTMPAITFGMMNGLEVSLPNIEEQKRIAGILSSLDDKIDLLGRQNTTLEAMAETIFRQYFIENAKGDWKDGVIADIIDFNPMRKLSKGTIAPFLEMSNLSTTTYAPNGWYDRAFSSGTKFKNGDTLLARITPCLENGKTAYVDFLEDEQVAWGSTEYIVMRPKGELHPFFAYIVAKYQDFRDYAESCMSGSSGRQRVDIDNLKGYEIKIPDNETIKRFKVFIESIVSKMNCNNKQIRSLTKLRNTLLPKLMNNEIKICQ